MKFRIEKVYVDIFVEGSEEYKEILSNLNNAGIVFYKVKDATHNKFVKIYADMNSFEELNRLVKEFGCSIVYGDEDDMGFTIIEKYDTYRE